MKLQYPQKKADTPQAQSTQINTTEIKIPERTMLSSVEKFALGESRAQIAEELLNDLPDELQILSQMERGKAKALLCSRLRQADPNSSKFASKYREHYNTVLKAVREAVGATMRSAITKAVQRYQETDEKLDIIAEKLWEHIETSTSETIGSPEMLNNIKIYISTCKARGQNVKELTALLDIFEKSHDAYEKKHKRHW